MREQAVDPSLPPDSPLSKAKRKRFLAEELRERYLNEITVHEREIAILRGYLNMLEPGFILVDAEIEALSAPVQAAVELDPSPQEPAAPIAEAA